MEYTSAFDLCKQTVAKCVTLAHLYDSKINSVYTNSSNSQWTETLTQGPVANVALPHTYHRHEPLAFHSGRFSDAELGCSTIERKSYVVLTAVERSHWLTAFLSDFDLFKDHDNLIFIFYPTNVMLKIRIGSLRKTRRWGVRMSAYNYIFVHIGGTDS